MKLELLFNYVPPAMIYRENILMAPLLIYATDDHSEIISIINTTILS